MTSFYSKKFIRKNIRVNDHICEVGIPKEKEKPSKAARKRILRTKVELPKFQRNQLSKGEKPSSFQNLLPLANIKRGSGGSRGGENKAKLNFGNLVVAGHQGREDLGRVDPGVEINFRYPYSSAASRRSDKTKYTKYDPMAVKRQRDRSNARSSIATKVTGKKVNTLTFLLIWDKMTLTVNS